MTRSTPVRGHHAAEPARREGRLASFVVDVRHAARGLVRAPGFTCLAVALLAIGLGSRTAMFDALDGVLLSPLP